MAPFAYGDPHLVNILGDSFDVNFIGIHSMIRIPGDGRRAGKSFELSARVADFGHLKQIYHCQPFYFDMFQIRGELLGGGVTYMEVLRDGAAGVSFSVVMVDGHHSRMDLNLSARATLQDGAVFGNVTVLHKTRQAQGFRARHLLRLIIQPDPPIEVTVYWWNKKPFQPGLNLRVHGLRPKLGAVGGLLGQDPHGKVSADPGIRGCPPRARADIRRATPNAKANGMLLGNMTYPDVMIH